MGWLHNTLDERGEHEGYVVAYVPRDWVANSKATELASGRPVATVESTSIDGTWRELGVHPLDREYVIRGFPAVGAACVCGWRSPRQSALGDRVEWFPNIVEHSDALNDRLRRLWLEHLAQERRNRP